MPTNFNEAAARGVASLPRGGQGTVKLIHQKVKEHGMLSVGHVNCLRGETARGIALLPRGAGGQIARCFDGYILTVRFGCAVSLCFHARDCETDSPKEKGK